MTNRIFSHLTLNLGLRGTLQDAVPERMGATRTVKNLT